MENLSKHIENILKLAFKKVQYAYNNHKEGENKDNKHDDNKHFSRLVFPSYSNNETRISEQELRFAFVEAFNEYCNKCNEKGDDCNLLYSIETPTKEKYSGFSKTKENPNPNPRVDENGRSGEFDMVIFNKELKRICLIEFKANNASDLDHRKDFVKLNNDKEGDKKVLRYFVEIIGPCKDNTIDSIKDKIKERGGTKFVCYSLEKKGIILEKPEAGLSLSNDHSSHF